MWGYKSYSHIETNNPTDKFVVLNRLCVPCCNCTVFKERQTLQYQSYMKCSRPIHYKLIISIVILQFNNNREFVDVALVLYIKIIDIYFVLKIYVCLFFRLKFFPI